MESYKLSKKINLLHYYILTHGVTGAFWVPAAIFSFQYNVISKVLHYTGGSIPFVVTIFYISRCYTKAKKKEFVNRLFRFKSIKLLHWLIILALPFLIRTIAFLIDYKIFSDNVRPAPALFINMTITYALFLLPFGSIPEEIAWRGFAQQEMQQKLAMPLSTLIVGILWALWHLPLFFISDTYQYNLGFNTIAFWNFMLSCIVISFIYTWIYNNTSNSILAVILFHYTINLSGEAVATTSASDIISTLLFAFIAIILLFESKNYKAE